MLERKLTDSIPEKRQCISTHTQKTYAVGIIHHFFLYFATKTCEYTHNIFFINIAILMSTHNICCCGEIKIKLSTFQLTTIEWRRGYKILVPWKQKDTVTSRKSNVKETVTTKPAMHTRSKTMIARKKAEVKKTSSTLTGRAKKLNKNLEEFQTEINVRTASKRKGVPVKRYFTHLS